MNSDKNKRPIDGPKPPVQLFGYQSNNNNNMNSNAAAASPYTNGNGGSHTTQTTNPYGSSSSTVSNNDNGLGSDQGKGNEDWFSPGPSSSSSSTTANIINPYAPRSNTNATSSSMNTNGHNPAFANHHHSIDNSSSINNNSTTMNHSNDTTSNPTVPDHSAFAGSMDHMQTTPSHPRHHTLNGSSGIMNSNAITPDTEDYDDEPPLLEELGINFRHIRTKVLAVVLPMKYAKAHIDVTIMADDDLAGPLAFVLLLGGELLLAAKMNFGYIYGLSLCGCFGMTLVLNLLSPKDSISMWTVLSVLGYSLIPVNLLAGVNALYRVRLMGNGGVVLAALTIGWCVFSSTRLFERGCGLLEQRFLVAYPVALFYSAFVMLTIF